LISLVQIHRVAAWMVILIVGREFAVSGLRSIAAAVGYTIQASELGKTKMVTQVLGISLVLMSIRWKGLTEAAVWAMWAVVIFTVASAVDYFRKFWRKIDDGVKLRRRHELLQLEREKKRVERRKRRAAAVSQPTVP
ncbi:MAG: CDP-alcohol phosphatidyltransferase family protein, partial [Bryobacteraceae bacterium]